MKVFLVLVWLFVVFLAGYGWINNIIKLIGMSIDPLTGLLIVRVVGIFIPPVGAIVGYF